MHAQCLHVLLNNFVSAGGILQNACMAIMKQNLVQVYTRCANSCIVIASIIFLRFAILTILMRLDMQAEAIGARQAASWAARNGSGIVAAASSCAGASGNSQLPSSKEFDPFAAQGGEVRIFPF